MPFLEALTTPPGTVKVTRKVARQFTAFGETKKLQDWVLDPRCEVSLTSLARNVNAGLSVEDAMLRSKVEPPSKQKISAFGETKGFDEWARDPRCLIAEDTLRKRIRRGEPPELAMARGIAPEPSAGDLYRPKTAFQSPQDAREHNASWGRLYEAWGERMTLREWSRDPRCAVSSAGLLFRISRGIPVEEALTGRRRADVQHDIDDVLFEAFGKSQSMAKWLTDPRCTVPRSALLPRLKAGVPFEKALTAPYRPKTHPKMTAFGESKSLREWAKDPRCEVSIVLLQGRMKVGFELETAMRRDGHRAEIVLLEAFGERKRLKDWSRDPRCSVTDVAIRHRLQHGISLEEAITAPHTWRQSSTIVTAFGETKNLSEWEKDPRARASASTIRKRVARGYSPERAISTEEYGQDTIIGTLVDAFGERKSIADWANDDRAAVLAPTIISRLRRGYPPEMAIAEIPVNRPTRRFWDLKRRGLEIVDPKSDHAIGPTLADDPTSRQSDLDKMEAAVLRSIAGGA